MNFIEIDKIPKNTSTCNNKIKKLVDDFLKSGIKYAKIILDENEIMPTIYAFRHFTRDEQYSKYLSIQEREDGIYLKRLNLKEI